MQEPVKAGEALTAYIEKQKRHEKKISRYIEEYLITFTLTIDRLKKIVADIPDDLEVSKELFAEYTTIIDDVFDLWPSEEFPESLDVNLDAIEELEEMVNELVNKFSEPPSQG